MEYNSGMKCYGKLRRVLVGRGRCPCSLWGWNVGLALNEGNVFIREIPIEL